MTNRELMDRAFSMLEKAYVPYSNYPVGAAILCSDGSVFTGCNVENAAYGDCICAERTAAVKAVSEGHQDFETIAICCGTEHYASPCGSCRQFLNEFNPNMTVLCARGDGAFLSYQLSELLPCGFGPKDLNKA